MRSRLALGLVLAACVTAGSEARADVAPPDTCQSVGQSCSNAGPQYDAPGVCVASMCLHPLPDGGSSSYACSICEATDAGTTSTGGGSSKSGCAMSPLAREGATGVAMLALGIGALVWGRRRRP